MPPLALCAWESDGLAFINSIQLTCEPAHKVARPIGLLPFLEAIVPPVGPPPLSRSCANSLLCAHRLLIDSSLQRSFGA